MAAQLKKIEVEALALSPQERAFLADRLLGSLSGTILSDVDEAWILEAEFRYSEYKKGHRRGIDAAIVLAEADLLIK